MPSPIHIQWGSADQLITMLQHFQVVLPAVLGSPPTPIDTNTINLLGQIVAQAQKVRSDMANLQSQLATAQQQQRQQQQPTHTPVQTSFPPVRSPSVAQQAAPVVVAVGAGSAVAGFVAGLLVGRR